MAITLLSSAIFEIADCHVLELYVRNGLSNASHHVSFVSSVMKVFHQRPMPKESRVRSRATKSQSPFIAGDSFGYHGGLMVGKHGSYQNFKWQSRMQQMSYQDVHFLLISKSDLVRTAMSANNGLKTSKYFGHLDWGKVILIVPLLVSN